MSAFGEQLLFLVNQAYPNQHNSLLEAKLSPEAYNSFFASRATSSFAQFGRMDLKGKHVLDIGCGLGANINFLLESGASHVTGLDISESQISQTKQMFDGTYQRANSQISFVTADAAQLPFEDNAFDAMVAADTFEHIEALSKAMKELARVLKPGGQLYAYFPPFYAPWGAHMVNWITLPWCQVFFSEETILNVARRLEAEKVAVNIHLPAETRLDLGEGKLIPFVNHLTIKHFSEIIESLPAWQVKLVKLLPPNWRTREEKFTYKLFSKLNQIPYVREMFTAKAVYILQKQQR